MFILEGRAGGAGRGVQGNHGFQAATVQRINTAQINGDQAVLVQQVHNGGFEGCAGSPSGEMSMAMKNQFVMNLFNVQIDFLRESDSGWPHNRSSGGSSCERWRTRCDGCHAWFSQNFNEGFRIAVVTRLFTKQPDTMASEQSPQTPEEKREELCKLHRLQVVLSMTLSVLRQDAELTLAEARGLAARCKSVALAMFPDKEPVFELIYAPRLEREIRERFPHR
jgi:hypothetical protein